MSTVFDPTLSQEALESFAEALRRDSIRTECTSCERYWVRTSISADICPHCQAVQ